MKKLLSFLGAFSITSTPVATFVGNMSKNVTDNPIDNAVVSEELQRLLEQIKTAQNLDDSEYSDQEIIVLMNKCELGLQDTTDSNFYETLLNSSWQLLNHFQSRLEAIKYTPLDESYAAYFTDIFVKLENQESIKFSAKFVDPLKNYKSLKEEQAQLFFRIYNRLVNNIMMNINQKQERVNDLTNINARLASEISGLSDENKIYGAIIDVLNESLRLCGIFSNVFNDAWNNMQSAYKRAANDRENNWLAYVPFAGSIYVGVYSNDLQAVGQEIQIFINAFNDKNSEIAKDMNAFAKQISGALDQIKENQDAGLVEQIIKATGLDEKMNGWEKLTVDIVENIASKMGGSILDAILNVLKDIFAPFFAVGPLNSAFKDIKNTYTSYVKPSAESTINMIENAKKEILSQIKIAQDKIISNTNQINQDQIEMQKNISEINNLNVEIDVLNKNFNMLNSGYELSLRGLMAAGFTYYWYGEPMLKNKDENLTKSKNSFTTIEQDLSRYQVLSNLVDEAYKNLDDCFNENLNAVSIEWRKELKFEHAEINLNSQYIISVYDKINKGGK